MSEQRTGQTEDARQRDAAPPASRIEKRPWPPLQFRLIHIIYVMAVLGVSAGMFGVEGLFIGVWVIFVWGGIYWDLKRKRRAITYLEMGVIVVIMLFLLALLLPAVGSGTSDPYYDFSKILRALQQYHLAHGALPPAYIADEAGQPMHSWRVLLLPYLDEQALYDAYDFSEPWNGPNNSKLAAEIPEVFQCRRHTLGTTDHNSDSAHYFAVVGPQTAWPGNRGRSLDDIPDKTILLVEAHVDKGNWMAPVDFNVDEATRVLASEEFGPHGHIRKAFFYDTYNGMATVLADSWLHDVRTPISTKAARRLLTIGDGETAADFAEDAWVERAVRIRWDNIFRLAAFFIVILLPLPRALRRNAALAAARKKRAVEAPGAD